MISTLYCRFLSITVNPSFGWMDVEQVPGLPFDVAGHLHCLSTQGLPYVSTLLHTMFGLQTGNDSSVFWNIGNYKISKRVEILQIPIINFILRLEIRISTMATKNLRKFWNANYMSGLNNVCITFQINTFFQLCTLENNNLYA